MEHKQPTYIGPEQIIDKRKAYFYPCTQHFYQKPPQLVRGSMQYVFDEQGKRYTDFFAGVSVVACGHCNEEITRESVRQLQTLQHTTTIYLTQPMVDLAERLAEVLPGDLRRTFFCNSGSEANEGALLLARMYTGKSDFISMEGGLHGRTNLTMSVTGIPMWQTDPYLYPGVTFIPRPFDHKELHAQLSENELTPAARRSLEALQAVLDAKGDKIAAMIVEPIQGNGGIIVPPKGYYREVKKLLDAHGVLLIMDEVQTGFGRTGQMFGCEHFGIVPDIITMAKALGGGVPIAAFASTDTIAAALSKPSASTFGGNPVSAVTALAVLDYIERERLVQRAAERGGALKSALLELQQRYPAHVSDVRGEGLMLGMEILADNPTRGAALVDQILEQMKDNGILIGKNGLNRNVLAFQPPLIITEDDVQSMVNILDQVLAQIGESNVS
ncbi:aspartate aminotransferase family protein [Paenibacillus albiflavus]|uniref:alanine--glyoxylate transaminase n=1 Tax=Paenibacillus albiflavus TaxID=2545760 RepID=A0A4R4E9A2_9BACL|nr:aspartate aminotransferase family protein [Paenibacillus albiflavus]TCZ76414.1 aspartate aminotransferase family protein [Paenibacillus albiflavus]